MNADKEVTRRLSTLEWFSLAVLEKSGGPLRATNLRMLLEQNGQIRESTTYYNTWAALHADGFVRKELSRDEHGRKQVFLQISNSGKRALFNETEYQTRILHTIRHIGLE